MRTDGRTDTDMTKLIVAFRNFGNAPKNFQIKVQLFTFCLQLGLLKLMGSLSYILN